MGRMENSDVAAHEGTNPFISYSARMSSSCETSSAIVIYERIQANDKER